MHAMSANTSPVQLLRDSGMPQLNRRGGVDFRQKKANFRYDQGSILHARSKACHPQEPWNRMINPKLHHGNR
jgi:hypothetical protein